MKGYLTLTFRRFKKYFLSECPLSEFYGFCHLTDAEERRQHISNLLEDHKFLYPNPSVRSRCIDLANVIGAKQEILSRLNHKVNSRSPTEIGLCSQLCRSRDGSPYSGRVHRVDLRTCILPVATRYANSSD
jgi:hypothetical protein